MTPPATSRVLIRRRPQRAYYDRHTIEAVLDSARFAHVAFLEGGQPYCIPMLHARIGDEVLIHGSRKSRLMRLLSSGAPACLTVTVLDALVLARSAFEHTANYRSVTVLGSFRVIANREEQLQAFAAFTDKLVAGRWQEVRHPSSRELNASIIQALSIDEASAKVRSGPPDDDDDPDAALDIWAGELPLVTEFGPPTPSPGLRREIALSSSVEAILADQRADHSRSPR